MERIFLSHIHMPRQKEVGERGRISVNLEQITGAMTNLKVLLKLHFLKKTCAEHFGQTEWIAELGKH